MAIGESEAGSDATSQPGDSDEEDSGLEDSESDNDLHSESVLQPMAPTTPRSNARRLSASNIWNHTAKPSLTRSDRSPLPVCSPPRRASLPSALGQAEDLLKNLERRRSWQVDHDDCTTAGSGTVDALEAEPDELHHSSKPGLEWIARVQAAGEVRNKAKDVIRQLLTMIEGAGLDMSILEAREKIVLQDRFSGEIEGLLQLVTRFAFDLVSDDWEELKSLRKVVSELDDKIANMNRTYLLEISTARDRHRTPADVVMETVSKFGYDAQAEGAGHVEFYEPLQYLSAEVKSTVLAILDEKIKAIFNCDSTLRERTNAIEMARFEDAVKDDRLKSFENLNSKLRDENRDLRNRCGRLEKHLEKTSWELDQAQTDCKRMESELAAIRHRPTRDTSTQCVMCLTSDHLEVESLVATNSAQDQEYHCQHTTPPQLSALPSKGFRKKDPHKAPMVAQCVTRDAAVQVVLEGLPQRRCPERGWQDGSQRPQVRRKQSFEIAMERADSGFQARRKNSFETAMEKESLDLDETKTAMEVELNKLRRECETARQAVQQRDRKIAHLERDLAAAHARFGNIEAQHSEVPPTETMMQEDCPGLHVVHEMTAGGSDEILANTSSGVYLSIQEETREATDESADGVSEQAEPASPEYELMQQEIRALRVELDAAKADAAKAEQGRLEIVKACARGSMAQELSSEVAKGSQERAVLSQEIEGLKNALSMALSRNAALEAAVEWRASETQMPPKRKTQGIAEQECRQLENLHMQRFELREKIIIQREQVSELVRENTTLHLALREMQQEIQNLTHQLRRAVPDIEVMNADLEAVLGKMDNVVRNGGGAYMRLHKDQKLRDIAAAVRVAKPVAHDAEEPTASQPNEDQGRSRVIAQQPSEHPVRSPSSRKSLDSPSSPSLRKRCSHVRQSTAPSPFSTSSSSMCSHAAVPKSTGTSPLPSLLASSRSASSTSSVPTFANCEQRGSLIFGSKGGMAVLGGLGKPKLSGNG